MSAVPGLPTEAPCRSAWCNTSMSHTPDREGWAGSRLPSKLAAPKGGGISPLLAKAIAGVRHAPAAPPAHDSPARASSSTRAKPQGAFRLASARPRSGAVARPRSGTGQPALDPASASPRALSRSDLSIDESLSSSVERLSPSPSSLVAAAQPPPPPSRGRVLRGSLSPTVAGRHDMGFMGREIREVLDPSSVTVHIRCRPEVEGDAAIAVDQATRSGAYGTIHIDETENSVVVEPGRGSTMVSSTEFGFDRVWGPSANQEDVFEGVCEPLLHLVMQGFNTALFAYGPSGTGKTHTLLGDLTDPERVGVIPRAARRLFELLDGEGVPDSSRRITLSAVQLYNEQLLDLLWVPRITGEDGETPPKLRLTEDPKRGTIVSGLTSVALSHPSDVYPLLSRVEEASCKAETVLNQDSNRSHRLFFLCVQFRKPKESRSLSRSRTMSGTEGRSLGKSGATMSFRGEVSESPHWNQDGCLTLVDLAGSESVGRSHRAASSGTLTIEAGNINKSLLTLGRVISALANRKKHVPYRDSRLTRLCSEALGGRCRTAFIGTLAPARGLGDDSRVALEFLAQSKEALNLSQVPLQEQIALALTRTRERLLFVQEELQRRETFHDVELQTMREANASQLDELSSKLEETQAMADAEAERFRALMDSKLATQEQSHKDHLVKALAEQEARHAREVDSLRRRLEGAMKEADDRVKRAESEADARVREAEQSAERRGAEEKARAEAEIRAAQTDAKQQMDETEKHWTGVIQWLSRKVQKTLTEQGGVVEQLASLMSSVAAETATATSEMAGQVQERLILSKTALDTINESCKNLREEVLAVETRCTERNDGLVKQLLDGHASMRRTLHSAVQGSRAELEGLTGAARDAQRHMTEQHLTSKEEVLSLVSSALDAVFRADSAALEGLVEASRVKSTAIRDKLSDATTAYDHDTKEWNGALTAWVGSTRTELSGLTSAGSTHTQTISSRGSAAAMAISDARQCASDGESFVHRRAVTRLREETEPPLVKARELSRTEWITEFLKEHAVAQPRSE
jgi:kinesin family member 11